MKAIFGRLALLVVLPFIGTVGERQADAMNSGTVTGSSQDHPTRYESREQRSRSTGQNLQQGPVDLLA